jgi:hypothetical protein
MRRKTNYNIDEKKPLTRKLVEEWLKKASLRELNIFYDRNKIIIILCKELLKHMKKDKK